MGMLVDEPLCKSAQLYTTLLPLRFFQNSRNTVPLITSDKAGLALCYQFNIFIPRKQKEPVTLIP